MGTITERNTDMDGVSLGSYSYYLSFPFPVILANGLMPIQFSTIPTSNADTADSSKGNPTKVVGLPLCNQLPSRENCISTTATNTISTNEAPGTGS